MKKFLRIQETKVHSVLPFFFVIHCFVIVISCFTCLMCINITWLPSANDTSFFYMSYLESKTSNVSLSAKHGTRVTIFLPTSFSLREVSFAFADFS